MRRCHWVMIATIIVGVLLAACQPIRPEAAHSEPAATTPAPDLAGYEVEEWSDISPDGTWQANGLVALPKPGADQYYTE